MIGRITFDSRPAQLFDYIIDEKTFACSVGENAFAALRGARVEVPFGRNFRRGYILDVTEKSNLPSEKLKRILRFVDFPSGHIDIKHIEFAQTLADKYLSPVGEILNLIYPLNLPTQSDAPPLVPLTQKDDETAPSILAGIVCEVFNRRIEIYKEMISETLSGGSVVVVLPTEEDVRYFAGKFNEFSPVVWDSSFNPRQVADFFRRISLPSSGKGGGHLVIGTRRASFLNPWRLKRVIVERDYDYGHKDGRAPYYTSRDILIEKTRFSDIEVIFGGLVFSLPVFNLIKNKTTRIYGGLPVRFYGNPGVDSAIIIEKPADFSKEDSISVHLKSFLDGVYARGECAVIHSPRRSEKNAYFCRACRRFIRCSHCGSLLFVDDDGNNKGKKFFVCSVCGKDQSPSQGRKVENLLCPRCGSSRVYKKTYHGVDSIKEALSAIYPSAVIATVSSQQSDERNPLSDGSPDGATKELLKDADFVVTTAPVHPWRISKKIGAVLAINAGSEMVHNEYQSAEKFFLTVAEYVDFSEGKAAVILFPAPRAPAFVKDVSMWKDFYNFYNFETESRRNLDYPPFSSIAEIAVTAKLSPVMVNSLSEKIINSIKGLLLTHSVDELKKYKIELLDSSGVSQSRISIKASDISADNDTIKKKRGRYLRRIILKYEKLPENLKEYLLALPSSRIKIEVEPSIIL